jgi:hypothetical protein
MIGGTDTSASLRPYSMRSAQSLMLRCRDGLTRPQIAKYTFPTLYGTDPYACEIAARTCSVPKRKMRVNLEFVPTMFQSFGCNLTLTVLRPDATRTQLAILGSLAKLVSYRFFW